MKALDKTVTTAIFCKTDIKNCTGSANEFVEGSNKL